MITKNHCSQGNPHSELLQLIETYLTDTDKSARWLGLWTAQDARLVPNLRRGQTYPLETLLNVSGHILAFYAREFEVSEQRRPLAEAA